MGKLTDVDIRNWIAAGQPVAKSDGDGLTFTMSARQDAAKGGTWVLRYRLPGMKSQKEIKVGSYPDLSLANARKEAAKLRVRVEQGEDVAREKQKEKRERATAWTVRHLAEDYIEKIKGRLAPSTVEQRQQQIRDHITGRLGNLLVADVTPADIVSVTEAVAEKSLHVARLVLSTLHDDRSRAALFASALEQGVAGAISKRNSDAASRPRNRGPSKKDGRALVDCVRSESGKRLWNTAWEWLISQAENKASVGQFRLDGTFDDGGAVRYYLMSDGLQKSIKKLSFRTYWAPQKRVKKPNS